MHSTAKTASRGIRAKRTTRLCIWTIRHHDWLVARLREYVWLACGAVLLLSAAGGIRIETALRIIAFGIMGIVVALVGLVLARRFHLLRVTDPDLKAEAYEVMLALIRQRKRHRT